MIRGCFMKMTSTSRKMLKSGVKSTETPSLKPMIFLFGQTQNDTNSPVFCHNGVISRLTGLGSRMAKVSAITDEQLVAAMEKLPDVLFLLVGDLYYTLCSDAFEFHAVPDTKRNRTMDVFLKGMRERAGRPFLIGREMTQPEHGDLLAERGSGIIAALEAAFEQAFRIPDKSYAFDIRLIAYTPRDKAQNPFAYYAKPDERDLFGGLYERGLIRCQGGRIVGVTENLIDPLRDCVSDRIKVVEEAEYSWADVFSPELQQQVFRCWQQSLDF